jgi:hypothetical protein
LTTIARKLHTRYIFRVVIGSVHITTGKDINSVLFLDAKNRVIGIGGMPVILDGMFFQSNIIRIGIRGTLAVKLSSSQVH